MRFGTILYMELSRVSANSNKLLDLVNSGEIKNLKRRELMEVVRKVYPDLKYSALLRARIALAWSSTEPKILNKLAFLENERINEGIVRNPNAPRDALRYIEKTTEIRGINLLAREHRNSVDSLFNKFDGLRLRDYRNDPLPETDVD